MTDAVAAEHPACENCRWWDNSAQPLIADPDTGACRAVAPVADDRTGKARWPMTEYSDWCSAFAKRGKP